MKEKVIVITESVNNLLRKAMDNYGTQKDLANALNVSPSTVNRLYSGKSTFIRADMIDRLEKVLNITLISTDVDNNFEEYINLYNEQNRLIESQKRIINSQLATIQSLSSLVAQLQNELSMERKLKNE